MRKILTVILGAAALACGLTTFADSKSDCYQMCWEAKLQREQTGDAIACQTGYNNYIKGCN
jgi:hypothetical protein